MSAPDRHLPAIGSLLELPQVRQLCAAHGRALVTHALRAAVAQARSARRGPAPGVEAIVAQAADTVRTIAAPSLRRVINATGVVLHTNLGRAPLGRRVLDGIAPVVLGYSNVEFDLATGRRGHRAAHVARLLRFLTGAQDALVVNNNAAAIILILHHFANGREVIISRGEMIEIGGSFRIPEIMAAAGARMVEVGTTNKTRLSDYQRAVTRTTAVVFRAHRSNYAIRGFTEAPSSADLAALAHRKRLLFVHDLGSGLLRSFRGMTVAQEPDVAGALADGGDLVTFSGDKLVGGPQAGIVVGKTKLVQQLAADPLMRALRVGKLTLAALGAACRSYLSDTALRAGNPTVAMLEQDVATLTGRAERLRSLLAARGVASTVRESMGATGGGALPDLDLPSRAVALTLPKPQAQALYRGLMTAEPAVVGVMREGELWLDVMTVQDDEVDALADAVEKSYRMPSNAQHA